MSQKSIKKITCPDCGQEADFTVWRSINTMLDPEMKEKVRTREAFSFRCPECGKVVNIDYGFLYHQMEDEMMIYYVSGEEDVEQVYDMFRGNGKMAEITEGLPSNYLYRIVRSQNDLREKLAIFDAGLDDRVIELAKLFYAGKYFSEHPEAESDVLYFRPEEMELVFFREGKPVATGSMSKDFYDMVAEQYIAGRPALREDDIIIDMDWAYNVIREKTE